MNTLTRHPRTVKLLASHVAVVVVAVIVGKVWFDSTAEWQQGVSRELPSVARREAAKLAFRFGTVQHARQLFQELPQPEYESILDAEMRRTMVWRGRMLDQIYLAVIEQEQSSPTGPTPHLEAAADACLRSGRADCSKDTLVAQAKQVAAWRRVSP